MSTQTGGGTPEGGAAPVRGRFRPHPRGFGFLAPVSDDGVTPSTATALDPDGAAVAVDRVFVPPPAARGLIADDLAEASVALGDKGASATRVRVLDRPRRLVVGVVERARDRLIVKPDRDLGTGWLTATERVAQAVSAHVGEQVTVLVGTGEGEAPLAQALVAGPYPLGTPQAVRARTVVIVLGGVAPSLVPGGAGAVGLNPVATETTHTRLIGQLAGGRSGAAGGLDMNGRLPGGDLEPVDRRSEPCVTVDAPSTRDLDDAVAASWDGAATSPVHVAVHITDVAGLVGVGSDADGYARTVAATAYLASGANAPMLDPAVSEGTRSLVAGQDRPVLSVRMAVAADGSVADAGVEPAIVRSRTRLSYSSVEQWLAGDARQLRTLAGTQRDETEATVRAALEAARRLGVERDARGTLEDLFQQPELTPAVVGERVTVGLAEPYAQAYRLIERLMVAANEAVGGWLVERGVPALYRAHEGIDPQRRQRLRVAAELAGASVPALAAADGDPDRVAGQVVAEVDRLAGEGRRSERDLLISAATSSMARATYDADPARHRGLGTSGYCHFTSPLRRYADLVVHRQVRATLAGEPPPHTVAELGALSSWLAVRGGALARLEARERTDLWARVLEQGELSGSETATVTGLTPAGLRVRVPRLGLSGFVRAEDVVGGGTQRATLEVDEHGLTSPAVPWRVGSQLPVHFNGLDDSGRPSWRLDGRARDTAGQG